MRISSGRVAEWPNASVLKTDVVKATGGSNPSSSVFLIGRYHDRENIFCRIFRINILDNFLGTLFLPHRPSLIFHTEQDKHWEQNVPNAI